MFILEATLIGALLLGLLIGGVRLSETYDWVYGVFHIIGFILMCLFCAFVVGMIPAAIIQGWL